MMLIGWIGCVATYKPKQTCVCFSAQGSCCESRSRLWFQYCW